ncbi:MAG: aminotransferase class I/II-fold pyridoxal phosphate-dependent enzyme [Thermodesulfobacteriota bacterium]
MTSREKLAALCREQLAALESQGRRKGREQVATAIIPPANGRGPRVLLAGQGEREFLRMNSNSYLGLSLHPKVIQAAARAAEQFGAGPGAVRFISGTCAPHVALEERLARFHGREAAMLFSAAYAAVVGILPQLLSPETVVISDALNHNCIINAIRLAKPLAKAIYPHLDLGELEKQLAAHRGRAKRAVVVTDGIFSMRGDHAPLAAIAALCEQYQNEYAEGVLLVVDDSHGVGAFGPTGRGTEEYAGGRADLLVATLGKALGVNGGYVAADGAVIELLRETASLYVYSNPLTPVESAAALAALDILDSEEGLDLLATLRSNTARFRSGLRVLGYETIAGDHPIVPLLVRDTQKTAAMVHRLFERNILATGLNYPIVPKGEEEIRFQLSASHTEGDIDYVLEVLGEEGDKGR